MGRERERYRDRKKADKSGAVSERKRDREREGGRERGGRERKSASQKQTRIRRGNRAGK